MAREAAESIFDQIDRIKPVDITAKAQSYAVVRSRVDGVVSVGLLSAVVFTALAHGAVETWSVAIFELMIIGLVLLWCCKAIREKQLVLNMPVTALPIGAILVVGLAQNVTGLSKDVEATGRAVAVIFFLVISLLIAATFLSTRERLRALANFLVVYGLGMAVFALVQSFTWDGRFYWFRPNTQSVSPFGPFVNHNHFAGYMELLLFLPVGLVVTRGVRGEARLFYGFAAAMMGVAVIASLSRGGMVSVFAGLIFLIVVNARLRKHARQEYRRPLLSMSQGMAAVLIGIAIIAGIIWIGAGPVIDRAAQSFDSEGLAGREWIWHDTLAMIKANPIVGVGLGAFQTAYPIYSNTDGSLVINAAHNDYLQVLADGGIIGGAIALWFLVLLFRALGRGMRSRDSLRTGLALGGGSGIFAILVHSLFDFNLQLPGNALLFLLMVAVLSRAADPEPNAV